MVYDWELVQQQRQQLSPTDYGRSKYKPARAFEEKLKSIRKKNLKTRTRAWIAEYCFIRQFEET